MKARELTEERCRRTRTWRGFVGWSLGVLVIAACLAARPAQAAEGPIVLMGVDAADRWTTGQHGPVGEYETVVTNLLVRVSNGGSGMLVVGGGKSPADMVTTFWSQISADIGVPVTFVNGAAGIAAQPFAGFALIAVVCDYLNNPSGGLTQAENDALAARAADIAAFWNGGGGVFGLSSDFFFGAGPYGWFSGIGALTANIGQGYVDNTATPDGNTVGLDDTTLDVEFWHDTYLAYPPFMSVLMTRTDNGQPSVIGFLPVPPQGDDPPTCINPANITVEIGASDSSAVVVYPAPVVTVDPDCEPSTVEFMPPSGSSFPVGTTTVLLIVSDSCGQAAACSFTVTVTKPAFDPMSPGYWKNHADEWPATTLTLGSQSYMQTELLSILNTSTTGDASMILAHHIIAAKLNLLSGSDPAVIGPLVAEGDALLSLYAGKLPYKVKTSSAIGKQMTGIAGTLSAMWF